MVTTFLKFMTYCIAGLISIIILKNTYISAINQKIHITWWQRQSFLSTSYGYKLCFTCVLLLIPTTILFCRYSHALHFTNEVTEAQRHYMTLPRLHSKELALDFELKQHDFTIIVFNHHALEIYYFVEDNLLCSLHFAIE